MDLEAAVEVTDKHDGSLGILYPAPDGRNAVATRGAFESAQALHASELYRREYERAWRPESGWTYLWEIVYPANRIVRCYGTIDDLYLLGAVEIASATRIPRTTCAESGPARGPRSSTTRRWRARWRPSPRPNAEGVVVRYLDGPLTGTMVKLKQADYVAMHRIVAGYTPRRLWERCAVHDVAAHFPCRAGPAGQMAQAEHRGRAGDPGLRPGLGGLRPTNRAGGVHGVKMMPRSRRSGAPGHRRGRHPARSVPRTGSRGRCPVRRRESASRAYLPGPGRPTLAGPDLARCASRGGTPVRGTQRGCRIRPAW